LCHPEVAACLAEHFVIWAGDVSQPDAYRLATQVGVQRFPFFAVLMCLKNNPDSVVQYLLHPLAEDPQLRSLGVRQPKQPLVMKCDELVQADTFLASLTKVVDTESIHLTVTRLEQEELSTSRLIREEQDFEYNEVRVAHIVSCSPVLHYYCRLKRAINVHINRRARSGATVGRAKGEGPSGSGAQCQPRRGADICEKLEQGEPIG
jgi:hypothetical protein